jgi:hypothetical protein
MRLSTKRAVFVGAALVLICAVSIRTPSNPQVAPSRSLFAQAAVPAPVANSLKSACLDCHSNETQWPWYAHAPIASLLLAHDVAEAREHLNLSDWQSVREKGPEQLAAGFSGICENLLSGAMPKRGYIWMHPSAKLSKQQISAVCSWTDKQQMDALSQATNAESAGR